VISKAGAGDVMQVPLDLIAAAVAAVETDFQTIRSDAKCLQITGFGPKRYLATSEDLSPRLSEGCDNALSGTSIPAFDGLTSLVAAGQDLVDKRRKRIKLIAYERARA